MQGVLANEKHLSKSVKSDHSLDNFLQHVHQNTCLDETCFFAASASLPYIDCYTKVSGNNLHAAHIIHVAKVIHGDKLYTYDYRMTNRGRLETASERRAPRAKDVCSESVSR